MTRKSLSRILLAALFLITQGLFSKLQAQDTTITKEINDAAIKGSQIFLGHLANESRDNVDTKGYGFHDLREIQEAQLGLPLWVYLTDTDKIADYDGKGSIFKIASPGGLILFPVVVQGEIRAFISVNLVNGKWEATGMGEVALAKQWEAITKEYPSQKGYEPILVVITQIRPYFPYFVVIKYAGKLTMSPLIDWGNIKHNVEYEPTYILNELRDQWIELRKTLPKYDPSQKDIPLGGV